MLRSDVRDCFRQFSLWKDFFYHRLHLPHEAARQLSQDDLVLLLRQPGGALPEESSDTPDHHPLSSSEMWSWHDSISRSTSRLTVGVFLSTGMRLGDSEKVVSFNCSRCVFSATRQEGMRNAWRHHPGSWIRDWILSCHAWCLGDCAPIGWC